MPKHTPGPWQRNEFACHEIESATGAPIANVYSIRREMGANASLIATAPELLDTLKMLADAMDPTLSPDPRPLDELLEIARKVIEEAEGVL